MRKSNSIIALALLILTSCSNDDMSSSKNEIVLCPGATLTHRQGKDVLVISAPTALRRIYHTNETTVEARMIPRDQRWYGSLGLYIPTGSGSVHLVTDEGYQHFNSEKEFYEWLEFSSDDFAYRFTSSGLVIRWRYQQRPTEIQSGPDSAMHVELWQVYIDGKKPRHLHGATDNDFAVVMNSGPCSKPERFVPQKPKVIGGLTFSGRVLDLLAERGLKPTDVKELIARGRPSNRSGLTFYYNDEGVGDLLVVGLNRQGEVAFVME